MKKIIPLKLKQNDELRIITPARSMAIIEKKTRQYAEKALKEIGLKLTFGKFIDEKDEFSSTSIKHRLYDLHQAFADKKVKAIITVIGGFNSNQLLKYIDWKLIKNNPKIFCGYSDITALLNAIFVKTGLITYYGPHYSTFGNIHNIDYTMKYFLKALFNKKPIEIKPSPFWSDDSWWLYKKKYSLIKNQGWLLVNKGKAKGTILGGNLCTFNLLQGTEYFPRLRKSILFLEDDYESPSHVFDRDLQSLIHLPDFNQVQGLVIGRFQKASKINRQILTKIIKTKKELNKIPVIANVDFGHTDPKITFPIGGKGEIVATNKKISIKILDH